MRPEGEAKVFRRKRAARVSIEKRMKSSLQTWDEIRCGKGRVSIWPRRAASPAVRAVSVAAPGHSSASSNAIDGPLVTVVRKNMRTRTYRAEPLAHRPLLRPYFAKLGRSHWSSGFRIAFSWPIIGTGYSTFRHLAGNGLVCRKSATLQGRAASASIKCKNTRNKI